MPTSIVRVGASHPIGLQGHHQCDRWWLGRWQPVWNLERCA